MDLATLNRLRSLFPKKTLEDVATGQVRVTAGEVARLRRVYGEHGIDLAKPFVSDRALLLAWSATLTDDECDRLAELLKAVGVMGEDD